jgi:hypothetical protein
VLTLSGLSGLDVFSPRLSASALNGVTGVIGQLLHEEWLSGLPRQSSPGGG